MQAKQKAPDFRRNPVHFCFNRWLSFLQTGYPHGLVWPLLVKYHGNESLIANMIYHVNMPKPLRLAEQYLIRAEAYCQEGNFPAASADLTTLSESRHSAGGSLSVNKDNWLQTISDERVKELYMEGFRLMTSSVGAWASRELRSLRPSQREAHSR